MARIKQSRTFRKILNNEEYDIENPELAEAENMNIEDEIIGGATEDDLNKVAENMEIATEEMDVNEQIANDVEEQIEANEQAIEEGNVTEEEARVSQECLQLAMRDLNMSESDITYLRFTTESINRDPKQVLVANNEALGGVWEKAKEMAKKAWKAIKSFFRKIIDFFKKLLPTRKNKLLKLQKILKDINGSSVHEEIQDEWDSVAEDKFMAYLNLTKGKIVNYTEYMASFSGELEAEFKYNNEQLINLIKKASQLNTVKPSNEDNDNIVVGYKPKPIDFTSPEYVEFEKYALQALKDTTVKTGKLNNKAMKALVAEQQQQYEATHTKDGVNYEAVKIPLSGSSYKVICFSGEYKSFMESASKEINEETITQFSKSIKIETESLDYTKLDNKSELDKSTALDNIENVLKYVNNASKSIDKFDKAITKAISNTEKDIETLYKEDSVKNNTIAKSLKKVIDAVLSSERKYIAELVSALNTTESIQYKYTVAYATHTIKGIKKKETDKENNK